MYTFIRYTDRRGKEQGRRGTVPGDAAAAAALVQAGFVYQILRRVGFRDLPFKGSSLSDKASCVLRDTEIGTDDAIR